MFVGMCCLKNLLSKPLGILVKKFDFNLMRPENLHLVVWLSHVPRTLPCASGSGPGSVCPLNHKGLIQSSSGLLAVCIILLLFQNNVACCVSGLYISSGKAFCASSGHLLGLSHDDSKFCEERFGVNSDKRLMSSILTSIDASKPWSRCTSATITDFFDDGNGETGDHNKKL